MIQRVRRLTLPFLLLAVSCGSQEPGAGAPAAFREELAAPRAAVPRLDFSTYFGGPGEDTPSWTKLAPDGSIYVVGSTTTLDLPGTTQVIGPLSPGLAFDGFVLKLHPDGSLAYLTRFGGAGAESVLGVDVDHRGAAYVVGFTDSTDFPITAGALQAVYAGGATDGFVLKLAPDGSRFEYATFLGGSGEDRPFIGPVDQLGRVGVIGHTSSTDYPIMNAVQARYGGGPFDAFVTKLSRDGSRVIFSTYLGGDGDDEAWDGNVDARGNLYLDGQTSSADFPVTRKAFQGSSGGGQDAFIAKLTPAGALVYSSYFGGSGDEFVSDCGLDAFGNAYVTGMTSSIDLPTTARAFQPGPGGGFDGYVARVSPNGSLLEYSTYVGGSGGGLEVVGGVRVDARGSIYLVGATDSRDFPVTGDALQPSYGGGDEDLFVMRLDARGALRYATFLGGSDLDFMWGSGTGLDARGRFTFSGATWSPDFPTTPGALQSSHAGGSDVAVVRVAFLPAWDGR